MAAETHPVLSLYWPGLCSWDGQAAAWAVQSLRLAIEEEGDERPGPAFTALIEELDEIAITLIHGLSSSVNFDMERVLGGIRTLEALVQVGDSQAAKIESKRAGGADRRATFSRELCELVKVGSDVGAGGVKGGRKILLEIAAGTIGRLSQALSGEIRLLEKYFANPALELIRNASQKGEGQRYAGSLVLKELAEHAPLVMYDQRDLFFQKIWLVIYDLSSVVRVRAAAALGAMLRLVHERQSTSKWSTMLLNKVEEGFEQGTTERVHGSLLAIRQLLRHPGPWMAHRHHRRCRRDHPEDFSSTVGATVTGSTASTATVSSAVNTASNESGLGNLGAGAGYRPSSAAPFMLPPPARDLSWRGIFPAPPSGAPSTASSTASKTRGFFFPAAGGGAQGGDTGASMSGTIGAGRSTAPPPPSPHVGPLGASGVHGVGPGGGGGGSTGAVAPAVLYEVELGEFQTLCEKVLARKDHKEASVRRTVMASLSELAAFFPVGAADLLEPAIWFLINTLRKGQRGDRGLAYLSLARIGLAAGPAFWPNSLTLWNSVKEVVKDGLAEDRRDFCPQSLPCLEMIVIIGAASTSVNEAASVSGRASPAPPSAPPSPPATVRSSPANSIGGQSDVGGPGGIIGPSSAVVVGVVLHSDDAPITERGGLAIDTAIGAAVSGAADVQASGVFVGGRFTDSSSLPLATPVLSAANSDDDLLGIAGGSAGGATLTDGDNPSVPDPSDASVFSSPAAVGDVRSGVAGPAAMGHGEAEAGGSAVIPGAGMSAKALSDAQVGSAAMAAAHASASAAAAVVAASGGDSEGTPYSEGRTALSPAPGATAAGGRAQGAQGGAKRVVSLLDDDTCDLVDRAFNGGLSHGLVQTLIVVAGHAPQLQPEVQIRLMRMVDNVVQQFVPRSRGIVPSNANVALNGVALMLGVTDLTAGSLRSPPVQGVVGGGMEGVSIICESPYMGRKSSGGGGGSSGSGGLMWSLEGCRQLEVWRGLLFPASRMKPVHAKDNAPPHRTLEGRRRSSVEDTPMVQGDVTSGSFYERFDGHGGYFSSMSSLSSLAPNLQTVAEAPGRFWDLYGNAQEDERSPGNVVLALNILGSFDFYSLPTSDGPGGRDLGSGPAGGFAAGGGSVKSEVAHMYRENMLCWAMRLLHTHALRCLDDADERVRVTACSACCRLLSRVAVDARTRRHKHGKIAGATALSGVAEENPSASGADPGTIPHGGRDGGSGAVGIPGMGGFVPMPCTPMAGEALSDATGVLLGARGGGVGGAGSMSAFSVLGGGIVGGDSLGVGLSAGDGGPGSRRGRIRLSLSDDRIGAVLRENVASAGWGDAFGGTTKGEAGAEWVWARRASLDVLQRLLMVGLSDETACVRREVVVGLEKNEVLDPLVAIVSNVQCLFEAINDEILPVRRSAARLIGRASRQQPTVVVPFVRVALTQLGRHLEVSQDATAKKERIQILADLISSAGSLVRPYVASIMPLLLRQLVGHGGVTGSRDGDKAGTSGLMRQRSAPGVMSAVVVAVLRAMGAVSVVSPKDVLPVLDDVLLPAIVHALQDHTSVAKQEAAVKALGRVVGATGAVVRPYFSHLQLLDTLLAPLLRGGKTTDSLRLEVLKTVGILGVLDPVKLRVYRLKRRSQASESGGEGAAASWWSRIRGGVGADEAVTGWPILGLRDNLDHVGDRHRQGGRHLTRGIDLAGMLMSPTFSQGVRSGFGPGLNIGDGVRETLPELPPLIPSPQHQHQAQAIQVPLPPLPRGPAAEGDTAGFGPGRGGAARVLLQKAGVMGERENESEGPQDDDRCGGSTGTDDGGAPAEVDGNAEVGDGSGPAMPAGAGTREPATATAAGAAPGSAPVVQPQLATSGIESDGSLNYVDVEQDEDNISSHGSITSNETGTGPTRPTRNESQIWPLATGGSERSPARKRRGLGAAAAAAGAGDLGAVGNEDAAELYQWWDDGGGWQPVPAARDIGVNGEIDAHGAIYGAKGGGREEASYMKWGVEGGVWYTDGHPARVGGADVGDGPDGPLGYQAGAPGRWSGFSEIGAGGVRPADALGPGLEDHLPFMVTHTLVKVLRDPLLRAHHQSAVQTAVDVCRGLGFEDFDGRHLSGDFLAQRGMMDRSSSDLVAEARAGAAGGNGRGSVLAGNVAGVDAAGPDLSRRGAWVLWGGWSPAATPLPQLLSELLLAITRDEMGAPKAFREFLFREVTVLINAAGHRLPPRSVSHLIQVVHQSWHVHHEQCIEVARALHDALGSRGFRLLLPDLLPLALSTLRSERGTGPGAEAWSRTQTVMRLLAAMKNSLEDYLQLLLPVLLRFVERRDVELEVRRLALAVVLHLTADNSYYLFDTAARVIHTLLRVIATEGRVVPVTSSSTSSAAARSVMASRGGGSSSAADAEGARSSSSGDAFVGTPRDLARMALYGLSCMLCRLKMRYIPFVAAAHDQVACLKGTDAHGCYRTLVSRLLKGGDLAELQEPSVSDVEELLGHVETQNGLDTSGSWHKRSSVDPARPSTRHLRAASFVEGTGTDRLDVDQHKLYAAFDTTGCTKKGDWTEWMRRVSVELLRQSPSIFLRPCATLAQAHQPVAQDLFNAAFVTVWDKLFIEMWDNDNIHAPLIEHIQAALKSASLPPEILNQLLNLASFMELQDKPDYMALPLDTKLLASKAFSAHDLAKFLHYTELKFLRETALAFEVRGDEVSLGRTEGGMSFQATGGVATAGATGGRRRLRYRTESLASAMDSEIGIAATGVGWNGAWEPAPAQAGADGGRVTPVPGYPTSVSTAETGSGGGNPAGGHGPGVAGSSKYLGPSPDILEDLIAVYHQLGLDMAAAGILRQAEQRAKSGLFKLDIRPSWLEKLSRWKNALKLYETDIENCEASLTGRVGTSGASIAASGGGQVGANLAGASGSTGAGGGGNEFALSAAHNGGLGANVSGPKRGFIRISSVPGSRQSVEDLRPRLGTLAPRLSTDDTSSIEQLRMHLGSMTSDDGASDGGGGVAGTSATVPGVSGGGESDGVLWPTDVVVEWYEGMLGRLRCLDALGEHRLVLDSALVLWRNLQEDLVRVEANREPTGGFPEVAASREGRGTKRTPFLHPVMTISRPTTPLLVSGTSHAAFSSISTPAAANMWGVGSGMGVPVLAPTPAPVIVNSGSSGTRTPPPPDSASGVLSAATLDTAASSRCSTPALGAVGPAGAMELVPSGTPIPAEANGEGPAIEAAPPLVSSVAAGAGGGPGVPLVAPGDSSLVTPMGESSLSSRSLTPPPAQVTVAHGVGAGSRLPGAQPSSSISPVPPAPPASIASDYSTGALPSGAGVGTGVVQGIAGSSTAASSARSSPVSSPRIMTRNSGTRASAVAPVPVMGGVASGGNNSEASGATGASGTGSGVSRQSQSMMAPIMTGINSALGLGLSAIGVVGGGTGDGTGSSGAAGTGVGVGKQNAAAGSAPSGSGNALQPGGSGGGGGAGVAKGSASGGGRDGESAGTESSSWKVPGKMAAVARMASIQPAWRDWIKQAEVMGARAAWVLGEWTSLEAFVRGEHMQARRHMVEEIQGVETCLVLEAVVATQKGNLNEALSLIQETRRILAPGLASLLAESYTRSYQHLLTVMSLAELEEVVEYKRIVRDAGALGARPTKSLGVEGSELHRRWSEVSEHRNNLRNKWAARLQWVPKDVDVWRGILAVRSLVLKPREDIGTWLKLAGLARKSDRMELCANTLRLLGAQVPRSEDLSGSQMKSRGGHHQRLSSISSDLVTGMPYFSSSLASFAGQQYQQNLVSSSRTAASVGQASAPSSPHPRVKYALYKYMWAAGDREGALRSLEAFTSTLSTRLRRGLAAHGANLRSSSSGDGARENERQGLRALLVKCLLLACEWRLELVEMSDTAAAAAADGDEESKGQENPAAESLEHTLNWQKRAVELDPMSYDAWHAWALMHFQLTQKGNARYAAEEKVEEKSEQGEQGKNEETVSTGTSEEENKRAATEASTQTADPEPQSTRSRMRKAVRWLPKWPSLVRATQAHDREESSWAYPPRTQDEGMGSSDDESGASVRRRNKSGSSVKSKGLETSSLARQTSSGRGSIASDGSEQLSDHVIFAIRGFFRSIALGHNQPVANILQDTLRLLTLWFQHGKSEKVNREMSQGLQDCGVDAWLGVVPQLIARVHSVSRGVTKLLRELLVRIGRKHPQALIYPITVASKTSSRPRQEAAGAVMADMQRHNPVLVEEASLVSREMIKVAMTWAEVWHEGLEEASRMYFGDGNIEGMLDRLQMLHDLLPWETRSQSGGGQSSSPSGTVFNPSPFADALAMHGPEADTVRGVAFLHLHGRDLGEAWEWVQRYLRGKREVDLLQAWDIYYNVFRIIQRQLSTLRFIELRHVAPALPYARGLQLAVPGTYRAHADVVRIRSFAPTVEVITWSKQRPRRMTIHGGDGRPYLFLLKGREDLRQDERVMQLFGLVNALLASDRHTAKFNLSIQRYAVMPLSNNSGLIGWVPNCDTIHQLIKQYRESKEIRINLEYRIMMNDAPDYEKLPPMNKLEVFSRALAQTDGQDLSRMLWLKSQSAEAWLDRRTNYSQSLAVMCMAGYILGLGDRHMSNIMVDRITGRAVHIDFADCFEVAMQRDKFPERVPFRLTRMLVNAMEVSRIEGMFRSTCEMVMTVLRANRDSLMAMLEAFVHDPLISWRLLAQPRVSAPLTEEDGEEDSDDEDEDEDEDVDEDAEDEGRQENLRDEMQVDGVHQTRRSSVLDGGTARSAASTAVEPIAAGNAAGGEGRYRRRGKRRGGGRGPSVILRRGRGHDPLTEATLPGKWSQELLDSLSKFPLSQRMNRESMFGIMDPDASDKEGGDEQAGITNEVNERAVAVVQRIHTKLTGKDFGDSSGVLSVEDQVDRLIMQASDMELLCQHFVGWCPFW